MCQGDRVFSKVLLLIVLIFLKTEILSLGTHKKLKELQVMLIALFYFLFFLSKFELEYQLYKPIKKKHMIMILKMSCWVLWRFIFVDLKILPRYRHLNKKSVAQGHFKDIILRSQCLKLAGFHFVVSVLVNAQIHVIHETKDKTNQCKQSYN